MNNRINSYQKINSEKALTVLQIGSNAEVESKSDITVLNSIGSYSVIKSKSLIKATKIASNVTLTAKEIYVTENVGSYSVIKADSTLHIDGTVGSNASLTVENGNLIIRGSIGSYANISTMNDIIIEGSVGSNVTIKSNHKVSIRGSVGSYTNISCAGEPEITGQVGSYVTIHGTPFSKRTIHPKAPDSKDIPHNLGTHSEAQPFIQTDGEVNISVVGGISTVQIGDKKMEFNSDGAFLGNNGSVLLFKKQNKSMVWKSPTPSDQRVPAIVPDLKDNGSHLPARQERDLALEKALAESAALYYQSLQNNPSSQNNSFLASVKPPKPEKNDNNQDKPADENVQTIAPPGGIVVSNKF